MNYNNWYFSKYTHIDPTFYAFGEMAWQAAQAAHIALLREALEFARRSGADWQEVRTALAIQSDDAALREWGARLLEEMAEADAGPLYLRRRAAELRSGK